MKRVGRLIEKICDVDNLMLAYYKARRGKQEKYTVKVYGDNIVDNILRLRQQILSGDVQVGRYHYFKIYDPKERVICAASFEERVLHHAIINVCKPYFERHFIYDTYATREGKGVYKAIERAFVAMKQYSYVAKLDVRKYFDSISHDVLKKKLCCIFKDKDLLKLLFKIIDSYNVEPGRGIPIGNLTSQYFANYYLSSFDHYVKENLRVPVYVRYMDDMLLFASSKSDISYYVNSVEQFLNCENKLVLKPMVKQSTDYGISFLGYTLFEEKILLNRRSKNRLKRKIKQYEANRESGMWSDDNYMSHIIPLLAFSRKAYTKQLRKRICENYS